MTRKANRRFFATGAVAALFAFLAALIHQHTGSVLAYNLIGVFMLAAFVLLVVLGIAPWVGNLALRYPLQNTQGYRDDYTAEANKEAGPYLSEGWRRKRERASLRNLKAFGLYIEPDEKG